MAGRVQEVCAAVVDTYGGDAAAIWTTATDGKAAAGQREGAPRLRRPEGPDLRGPARQAARRPAPGVGRRRPAPTARPARFRSVADIDSPEALAKVRQFKQQMKAEARAKLPNAGVTARPPAGRTAGACPSDASTSAPRTGPTSRPSSGAASTAASTWSSCATSSSTTPHSWPGRRSSERVCAAAGVPVRAQRPSRPGRGHGGRRGPRRPGRPAGRRGPGGRGRRRPDRPVHPRRDGARRGHRERPGGAGPAPVDYLSAGPVVATPTKPGRPGPGTGYLTEARAAVALAGVGHRRGAPGHRGRTGRRRCPPLRGGPLAGRAPTTPSGRPGAPAADRRAPGRRRRLSARPTPGWRPPGRAGRSGRAAGRSAGRGPWS